MLDASLHIKLVDFGLSYQLPKDEVLSGFCGTPNYSTPKVFLQGPTTPSRLREVWNIRVILFTMVASGVALLWPALEEHFMVFRNHMLLCEVSSDLEDLLWWLFSIVTLTREHTCFQSCPEKDKDYKKDEEGEDAEVSSCGPWGLGSPCVPELSDPHPSMCGHLYML